jgi:hypothetical protein
VGVLHFWLGCGTKGMSGHYDQIKTDVAFRKNVVNRCGVQPTIIDKIGKEGMPSPVAQPGKPLRRRFAIMEVFVHHSCLIANPRGLG